MEEREKDLLSKRRAHLTKVIEAISSLSKTEEWSTLKEELFDGQVISLQKRLLQEVQRPTLNEAEIYKLQGQLSWANRYANLEQYAHTLFSELEAIKKKLT